MIDIIKKKLIPIFILLIVICVLFSTRVNGAVQDTSNYYDAYNSMEHDLEIVKSWMSSNFSSYDDFTNYLSTQFGKITNSHWIAMTDQYSQGTGGRIVLFLLSGYTSNIVDVNYYGIPVKGFTSSGQHTNVVIYPNNESYASTKYIGTVSQSTDAINFFSGWYRMKVEYLFTGSITTNQLIDNTDEMNLELQEQNDFLQNSNVVDDNTITGYTNEIDNSVSSIKDDFDNSNEKNFLTNFFDYLTVDNSEDYGSFESIDMNFTAFGQTYDIHIPASLTKDFILNAICHGNVTSRNTIVLIIQSVYGLVFGIFFVKEYISAFSSIITLNFDGFRGTNILRML